MMRSKLNSDKRVADTAPLEEGDFRFLDPKRLKAEEERWRYRPNKPKEARKKSAPKWSLRVPLDDGRDCYGYANDYYPDEWGSGDYRKSPLPGAARMHFTKDGMYFSVREEVKCPSRLDSPRISGTCSHVGIERHQSGDCVSGTYAWRDGITGRFHRPVGEGPVCASCGPAARVRPECTKPKLHWISQRNLISRARSALSDYKHSFTPRNFRLEGGSGWAGFWDRPPSGKVHVLDEPREKWLMYFTVGSDTWIGCRAPGGFHGSPLWRCVSGSYLWVDGKWGEYHVPENRAPICSACGRRPERGARCVKENRPIGSAVQSAIFAPRPPIYMAQLASGVGSRTSWEGQQRSRRRHVTPHGTFYSIADASKVTGRALTALGHGFAFYGEEYLPLRCVHCGVGRAAAAQYCKVANPIPEALLELLSAE
jgi:hypothetical protein